jgi:hypothetical protein
MQRPEDEDIEDDIEEGEIVVTDEEEFSEEEEDEIQEEGDEEFEDEFDEDMIADPVSDMTDMLVNVLTTPDGDTIPGALVNIATQLENQNRILIKIFSALKNFGGE